MTVDCLQSAFSLKIRLLLISSIAIANPDVIITVRDWDQTDSLIFILSGRPRFSRLAALPPVSLGFARVQQLCQKKIRDCSQSRYDNNLELQKCEMFNFWAHGFCAFHYEGSLRSGSRIFGEYKSLFTEIKRDLFIVFSFMIVKWPPFIAWLGILLTHFSQACSFSSWKFETNV